jgi:hypothetical protein
MRALLTQMKRNYVMDLDEDILQSMGDKTRGLHERLIALIGHLKQKKELDDQDVSLLQDIERLFQNHKPRPMLGQEIGKLNFFQHGGTKEAWEELTLDERSVYDHIGNEILAFLPMYGYTIAEIIHDLEKDPRIREQLDDARRRLADRRRQMKNGILEQVRLLASKYNKPLHADLVKWLEVRLLMAEDCEKGVNGQIFERLVDLADVSGRPDFVSLLDWIELHLRMPREVAKEYGCPVNRDPWHFIKEELHILKDLRD